MKPRTVLLTLLAALTAHAAASAQWTQTPGPEGAQITAITADNGTVVASTWGGSIYARRDGAWTLKSELDNRVAWVDLNDGVLLAAVPGQLQRSTDEGATWTTALGANILSITRDGSSLYALGGGDSVFVSSDNGMSWNLLFTQPSMFIGALAVRGETMIARAGFSQQMYRSTDRGITWTEIPQESGLPPGAGANDFETVGSTIYASTSQGFYRTTDDGVTWTGLNAGLPLQPELQNGGTSAVIATDGAVWTVSAGGLYRLDGSSWTFVGDIVEMGALADDGATIYSGARDGIWSISETDGTWRSRNDGLLRQSVSAFAAIGSTVVSNGTNGIHRTTNHGETWQRVSGQNISEFATIGSTFFARTEDYSGTGIYRSTDDGTSWHEINNGLPEPLYHISALTANGSTLFTSYYEVFSFHGNSHWESGGIFRSTNDGASWSEVSNGLPNDGFSNVPVRELAANGEAVVAVTIDGVFRSTNNGASWTRTSAGLPPKDQLVLYKAVAVGKDFYIASNPSIYRSTDNGATWSDIGAGLPGESYPTNVQDLKGDLLVTLKNTMGISRTFMFDGASWTEKTSLFPTEPGTGMLALQPSGAYLLGGTEQKSVWRTSLLTVSSVKEEVAVGASVTTHPNPFSDRATIRFDVPARAHVRLSVVDALGREVALLHDGAVEPGAHEATLDASELATGIYYTRLAIDGVAVTRPMSLVR